MIRDVQFEAAFLRAGLLVGLIHERAVSEWATDLIESLPALGSKLAEVLLAPCELTAMRDALRPLENGTDADRVAAALLVAADVGEAAISRSVTDRLRILSHIRREYRLTAEISAGIKDFEDRSMLAAAGVAGALAPTANELATWLKGVRGAGYFVLTFNQSDEEAAFVGALSRKMVRDRTLAAVRRDGAVAWVSEGTAGQASSVILNERAWQMAVSQFSPLPLYSQIPYSMLPVGARAVLDEQSVTPLGAEEAELWIAR